MSDNLKLTDIVHLLDIPSGSEDSFDSDDGNESDGQEINELWEQYGDIINDEDNELLPEEFGNDIIDELVNFPHEILSINVDSSHTQPPVMSLTNSSTQSLPLTNTIPIATKQSNKQNSPTLITLPRQPTKPIILKNVKWSSKSFPEQNTDFIGNSNLPSDILELETPYQIFKYFFTNDLMEHICSKTLKFSVQKDSTKSLNLSTNDLQKYVGILIQMSLVHISNVRRYWSPNVGNQLIQDTMNVNSFEKIRSNLHFNDNTLNTDGPNRDKTHKIRPIIETLKKRFCTIPLEEHSAVDEQMCSTKARNSLKVYMPNKPNKWGYKLFVLSGASGFAYNFELFSGQENGEEWRFVTEPDLGASANVVVRLSRVIPINKNYKLFFDNYYTTLPLLVYLKKKKYFFFGHC